MKTPSRLLVLVLLSPCRRPPRSRPARASLSISGKRCSNPNGRAWHDLAAGSRVVSGHPASRLRLSLARAGTGGLIAAFALLWGWANIWEPRYLRIMAVAHAKVGLSEIQMLETAYKARHGRYADSLFALATVSVDPRGFLRDAAELYQLKSFRFKAGRDRYVVVTRARDVDSTLVAISGP